MWTKKKISDLSGKTAIVTGANTGIGYEIALALHEAGAYVVLACRDAEKAQQAIEKILKINGKGKLAIGVLNLSSLEAIKDFAENFKKEHQTLDILINNAGVMMPPPSKTDDGFELQFGVNFLGHFALTAHLFPLLIQSTDARIVTLSSGAAILADTIDFDNLSLEKSYDAMREYATSKLANVLFTNELARRLEATQSPILSVAAHPGVVYTDLQRHVPADILKTAFAQYPEVMEPWQGALPALYAATHRDVKSGDFYGPDGDRELVGYEVFLTNGRKTALVNRMSSLGGC
jgi:NAD(P)-dependent dehydrogenase (short-subunit alcohol dehydrogenase family)